MARRARQACGLLPADQLLDQILRGFSGIADFSEIVTG